MLCLPLTPSSLPALPITEVWRVIAHVRAYVCISIYLPQSERTARIIARAFAELLVGNCRDSSVSRGAKSCVSGAPYLHKREHTQRIHGDFSGNNLSHRAIVERHRRLSFRARFYLRRISIFFFRCTMELPEEPYSMEKKEPYARERTGSDVMVSLDSVHVLLTRGVPRSP